MIYPFLDRFPESEAIVSGTLSHLFVQYNLLTIVLLVSTVSLVLLLLGIVIQMTLFLNRSVIMGRVSNKYLTIYLKYYFFLQKYTIFFNIFLIGLCVYSLYTGLTFLTENPLPKDAAHTYDSLMKQEGHT